VQEIENKAALVKQETVGSARTWLDTVLSRCQIKCFVELWGVSALIWLSGDANCASVGFSHSNMKFLLDHHSDVQGNFPAFLF
jgi:hypothetical protein